MKGVALCFMEISLSPVHVHVASVVPAHDRLNQAESMTVTEFGEERYSWGLVIDLF